MNIPVRSGLTRKKPARHCKLLKGLRISHGSVQSLFKPQNCPKPESVSIKKALRKPDTLTYKLCGQLESNSDIGCLMKNVPICVTLRMRRMSQPWLRGKSSEAENPKQHLVVRIHGIRKFLMLAWARLQKMILYSYLEPAATRSDTRKYNKHVPSRCTLRCPSREAPPCRCVSAYCGGDDLRLDVFQSPSRGVKVFGYTALCRLCSWLLCFRV